MKTILRILILLAAAMVVVGATLLISRTTWGANLLGGDGRGFERRFESGGLPSPQGAFGEGNFDNRPGLQGRMDREGRGGLSAFTWTSLLKNLGIVAAIAVIYALLDKIFFRRKSKTAANL